MHFIYRGVNDAFKDLVQRFHYGKIPLTRRPSRFGHTLTVEEPVIITYTHPRERVLFNPYRDCNPFFHLYESLWMLAGRNDVDPLAYYNSKIAEIASDDGMTFNGAYGYRWRKSRLNTVFSSGLGYQQINTGQETIVVVDQLQRIIDQLKRKPESRRVVLQMWNVEDDLLKIDITKDVCCNVCAFFSIRSAPCSACGGAGNDHPASASYRNSEHGTDCSTCKGKGDRSTLDMTVINRSNDMIWGMLGANVVHFSFLQEYVAAMVGVEVGHYHQITNNLHVYTANWTPEKWLADYDEHTSNLADLPSNSDQWYHSPITDEFQIEPAQPLVLDGYSRSFDCSCIEFVDMHKDGKLFNELVKHDDKGPAEVSDITEVVQELPSFLNKVAHPVCMTWHAHKRRNTEKVQYYLSQIEAEDWRVACADWIERRRRAADTVPS